MRASCRLDVAAGPGARTRFLTAAGVGALTPRRTGPDRVHLVAAAGGPLGGDDYALDIVVRAGARLEVCTAAASVVLAAGPGETSRLVVRARVEEGAELLLTPGPIVLSSRGRHEAVTEFDVLDGGRLLARELIVLGRSGETGGSGSFRTALSVAGRPALRQTVRLGTDPATAGPAVLAGARALGQLLVVAPGEPPAGARGSRAAWLPLAVPGAATFTVTDAHPAAAAAALDGAVRELDRPAPVEPRKTDTQVSLIP